MVVCAAGSTNFLTSAILAILQLLRCASFPFIKFAFGLTCALIALISRISPWFVHTLADSLASSLLVEILVNSNPRRPRASKKNKIKTGIQASQFSLSLLGCGTYFGEVEPIFAFSSSLSLCYLQLLLFLS